MRVPQRAGGIPASGGSGLSRSSPGPRRGRRLSDPRPEGLRARTRARQLILRFGWNTTCYQILNPGFERWFSSTAEGVVGYVEAGRYRMAAGAPVCEEPKLVEVAEEFRRHTQRAGLRVCFFGAEDRLRTRLEAERIPGDRLLLGAQPAWDPASWERIKAGKASLRAQLNRALNKGVGVELWPPYRAAGHPELTRCLDEWLSSRRLPPLHFLVEPDTLERLYDRLVFVARREGRSVGFLVASPVPARRGWLVEQIIRGIEAPNGTTELLVDAVVRHLGRTGARYLTLGLAPLSRRAGLPIPAQPGWRRALLAWLRAHGRRFYDFDGLDAFKAKFVPDRWEPVWALTAGGRIGPGTFHAIGRAFSGEPPLPFLARVLARAVRQELRWLREASAGGSRGRGGGGG